VSKIFSFARIFSGPHRGNILKFGALEGPLLINKFEASIPYRVKHEALEISFVTPGKSF